MLSRSPFASVIGLFALVLATSLVLAQADEEVPVIENSMTSYLCEVNADAVYVRSGPGENYYPTAKLDKGAQVTVVGHTFDWLKVIPPDTSFSYVAKMHVTALPDGKTGRVDRDSLNVRAGSSLNTLKQTVQTKLNTGDTVTILGEVDEYYRIVPPAGAALYVKKDFVTPLQPLASTETPNVAAGGPIASDPIPAVAAGTAAVAAGTAVAAEASTEIPAPAENAEEVAVSLSETPAAPTTSAVNPTAETAGGTPAATTPEPEVVAIAVPSAADRFDQLETDFQAMSKVDLKEQPITPAIADYEALLASGGLPDSMQRVAEARLATLKVRKGAMDQYAAAKASEQEMQTRTQALTAEKQELEQRIRENTQTYYNAVGTLQTSSLQRGPSKLYRLTDPSTGRTIVYIGTNDVKFAGMLGQFIGVRGSVVDDTQLRIRIITPDAVSAVDPAGLGVSYSAEMVPASVLLNRPVAP